MIIKKAGCILINTNKKEIGLVYREKYKDFSFPKGHLEEGETLEQCAIRETEEETGRLCKIEDSIKLPIITYENYKGDIVELHFYIGIDQRKTEREFDEYLVHDLVWIPKEKVKYKITYENLKEYWNKIEPIVNEILK